MHIHLLGASGGISEAGCIIYFFQGFFLLACMLAFIQTKERVNWKEERILINSLPGDLKLIFLFLLLLARYLSFFPLLLQLNRLLPSGAVPLQCHDASSPRLPTFWEDGIDKWPEKLLPWENKGCGYPGLNDRADMFPQGQQYPVTLHIYLEPGMILTQQKAIYLT